MNKYQQGITVLAVILVIVLLIAMGIGGYFLVNTNLQKLSQNYPSPTAASSATALQTSPTPRPIVDERPLPNTFYLTTSEGNQGLFITNKNIGAYFEGELKKIDPLKGFVATSGGTLDKNFTDLTTTARVKPALEYTLTQLNGLKSSDKYIFVSAILETEANKTYPDNMTNFVYQIDKLNFTQKSVWSHRIGASTYDKAKGAAYIDQISADNNYLVLKITDCYACEGTLIGSLILNIESGKEVYLERIGNIQFDLNNKKFSYQTEIPVQEPCQEIGPGCDNNGTRTVYQPSGPTQSADLP